MAIYNSLAIRVVSVVLIAASFVRDARAEPFATDYQVKRAVIVGIGNYHNSTQFGTLPLATNDAQAIREVLISDFGFADKHIRFLRNEDAKECAIQNAITSWPIDDLPGERDALIIFFAGHGFVDFVDSKNEGYLAAYDSDKTRLETCISMSMLRQWVGDVPCDHKLIVLASCYSGSLFRGEPPQTPKHTLTITEGGDAISWFLGRKAFWGLTASRDTTTTDGAGSDGLSRFTFALTTELRERAASTRTDHAFTIGELAPRVRSRVTGRLWAGEIPEVNAQSAHEIPDWGKLSNDTDGDFVFRPTKQILTPTERASRRIYSLMMQALPQVWEEGNIVLARQMLDELASQSGNLHDGEFEQRYWRQQLYQEKMSLPAYSRSVYGAVYSTDGKMTATAHDDGTVRTWSAETGIVTNTYRLPVVSCTAITESPGSGRLAVAGHVVVAGPSGQLRSVGKVFEIDIETSVVRFLVDAGEMVESLAYNRDGTILAAGIVEDIATTDLTYSILAWETQEGRELLARKTRVLASHIAFQNTDNPKLNWLQFLDCDETFREAFVTIDMAGQEIGMTRTNRDLDDNFAVSPDGLMIATSSSQRVGDRMLGTVQLWDAAFGELDEELFDTQGPITDLAFSSDGKRLACASSDRSLTVWNVGISPPRLISTLRGHLLPIKSVKFRPGRYELLSVSDGRIQPQLKTPGAQQPESEESGDAKAFSIERPAELMVWDLDADFVRAVLETDSRQPSVDTTVTGDRVAVGGDDGKTVIWDQATGKPVLAVESGAPVTGLKLTSDGKEVVVGTGDWKDPKHPGKIAIVDVLTGRERLAISADCGGVFALDLHPNGTQIAAACWNTPINNDVAPAGFVLTSAGLIWTPTTARSQIRIWQMSDGREVERFDENDGVVPALRFDADGSHLAWGVTRIVDDNGTHRIQGLIKLRDFATQTTDALLREHDNGVLNIAFSPSGNLLAAADDSGAIKIWDIANKDRRVLRGHQRGVTGVAFSSRGNRLFTSSRDRTIKIWDPTTGNELMTLSGFENEVASFAISRDEDTIVGISVNGNARVWKVPPPSIR